MSKIINLTSNIHIKLDLEHEKTTYFCNVARIQYWNIRFVRVIYRPNILLLALTHS